MPNELHVGREIAEVVREQERIRNVADVWVRQIEGDGPVDVGDVPLAFNNLRFRPWIMAEPGDPQQLKMEKVPKGKRGEELFHLILSGIREVYNVEAVIAGGAVRDHVAGNPHYKDVDVFIPLNGKDFIKGSHELGWQRPPALIRRGVYKKSKANTEGMMGFPTTARGQAAVQGMALDLVFSDQPVTRKEIDMFPIHAQRCVWTLEGGLMVSPEAQEDIDNTTFTIDPTITDKLRVEAAKTKCETFRERAFYKKWKIVEPNLKEWWQL